MAWILGIVLVVVLIGGAYYVGKKEAVAPTTETPTETTQDTTSEKMIAPKWTFIDKGEDAQTGAPMTQVSVTFAGTTRDLGVHQGSCSTIEGSSWTLVDGELSGAICWFAGGGVEFGIFKEGNNYVVKQGDLDEGSAEDPGLRGNFRTLVTF